MLRERVKEIPHNKDTWRTRISLIEPDNLVCIEHFDDKGNLLSHVRMDCDDAYNYAKCIEDVADVALGIE